MTPPSLPIPAIVWGAAGHALVVANSARLGAHYDIAGFLDEVTPGRRGEPFGGAAVLGGREVLSDLLRSNVRHVLLGVGDNRARLQIAAQAEALGFALGTVVHPGALVASDVVLGAGTFVGPAAVVNPAARIGRAAIINSAAVVEHHCEVGDGAHISPRAALAGGVRVGRLSWVGIGAVVIEKLEIGDEAQIGAGAVVVRNVPSRVVAYGVPARAKRHA